MIARSEIYHDPISQAQTPERYFVRHPASPQDLSMGAALSSPLNVLVSDKRDSAVGM